MPSDTVLAAYEKALAILRPLADAYPAVTKYQLELGMAEGSMGYQLAARARKPAEAMAAQASLVIVPAALAVGFCIATTVVFCIAAAYLLLGISRGT